MLNYEFKRKRARIERIFSRSIPEEEASSPFCEHAFPEINVFGESLYASSPLGRIPAANFRLCASG